MSYGVGKGGESDAAHLRREMHAKPLRILIIHETFPSPPPPAPLIGIPNRRARPQT
jgi:hypothetical protein